MNLVHGWPGKTLLISFAWGFALSHLTGCAMFKRKPETEEPAVRTEPLVSRDRDRPKRQELNNEFMEENVNALEDRVQLMEARLLKMQSQLQTTQNSLEQYLRSQGKGKKRVSGVDTIPVDESTHELDNSALEDKSFTQDAAVQTLRKAMIVFEAEDFSSAIMQFSEFLKQYADHPFAGSAQFLIGESYFKRGDYRLAEEEYARVLVSYDRSDHLPESLYRMMEINEKLQKPTRATRYRELLQSLFPQSPAAGRLKATLIDKPSPGQSNSDQWTAPLPSSDATRGAS